MTDAGTRFHDLPQVAIERLRAADRALQRRDIGRAIEAARAALQSAPDHPEALRCLARTLSARGPSAEALALVQRAAAALPNDAPTINTLAMILDVNGRRDAAVSAFRRASELAPESADFACNLGRILCHVGRLEESQQVLERALALNPALRMARATLVEVLRQCGRTSEAIAQCQHLLQNDPADIKAWSALAGFTQHRFDAGEIATMERLASDPALGVEGCVRLGFALGRAYEDAGRYAAAFSAYQDANAAIRAQRPWDAAAHSAEVDAILAAFPRAAPVDDPKRGSEVIFLVSLPRAGSTLIEQILASHPRVAGGDERMDLLGVIAEEGQSRQRPLSRWAGQAGADDWRRLGERYLERSARWRAGKPIFTDKLPGNWLWLGAAMAMLPGARVIECRRDPLETAWSCFCQIFAGGTQQFSYDFASIGAFVRDYERSMRHWRTLHPARIHAQVHEALLGDFPAQVRALLEFCGLAFDPACLQYHETRRNIRTISSAQVRAPLRRDTARAARYGPLLDPLRAALGLAAYSAHG